MPPLRSPWNNAPVYYKPVVSSTMDEAASLADSLAAFGTVIMADYQEQGRGRRHASAWESAAGENLLFTVLLPKIFSSAGLAASPLLIGLAVSDALEKLHAPGCRIKWPNDIVVSGKKICGILCRTRGAYLLAGIGINCNQRRFPPALAARATSLAVVLGRPVERETLLLAVLEALRDLPGRTDWRAALEARLAFRGERRTLVPEAPGTGRAIEGVVTGLGSSGELLLRLPDGSIASFVAGSLV
jgi:BirA family transcriptional regulator, biotin operon repressor / biotin---[acetyl-CoA-carboxylase] ligase